MIPTHILQMIYAHASQALKSGTVRDAIDNFLGNRTIKPATPTVPVKNRNTFPLIYEKMKINEDGFEIIQNSIGF